MKNKRQLYGQKSESAAVAHLKKNGYKIIRQNYRTKLGEIDIIAKDKDALVFVEVKAKRSDRFGHPKGAVTLKKQRKISMVALHYLKSVKQMKAKARFDVVSVRPGTDDPIVEIIKNAFELAYE